MTERQWENHSGKLCDAVSRAHSALDIVPDNLEFNELTKLCGMHLAKIAEIYSAMANDEEKGSD